MRSPWASPGDPRIHESFLERIFPPIKDGTTYTRTYCGENRHWWPVDSKPGERCFCGKVEL